MNELNPFFEALDKSIDKDSFVKITFSKPTKKNDGLRNVYVRQINLKEEHQLSFTYRYTTNDQVKNHTQPDARKLIKELIKSSFKIITLFTLEKDYSLRISKKGKVAMLKNPPSFSNKPPIAHDQPKKKRAEMGKYLNLLSITDDNGRVIPKMSDKYKQINKYLEIIEGLLKNADFPQKISIVDMGSGKGYLTFALYDYLVNQKKMQVSIKGIEQREELVDFCNEIAVSCNFENLSFEKNSIQNFKLKKIDILIALHACDTATDEALSKAIKSKATLVLSAPCCHKQIRQQLKGKEQDSPILKYGIFKERQFEMVTDTIRALLLEKHQYNTKVFEFISNEHTRKNIMLIGEKSSKKPNEQNIDEKIDSLKKEYAIENHHLETLLQPS